MNSETISNFEKITGFKLSSYFTKFVDFVNTKQQILIAYYSGDLQFYSKEVFLILDNLKRQSKELNDSIINNSQNFLTTDFWELLEEIENVNTELSTLNKMSKWLRSSILNTSYAKGFEGNEVLREGQSIERLLEENSFTNYDNEWMTASIRNNIIEESYDLNGGKKISLSFKNSFRSISYITTVVDNLLGKNIHGKDIDRITAFENNDLKILTSDQTIVQAANILINLKKGDVPEFLEDGVDEELIIGGNINSVLYPVIFRKIYNVFAKDDTFDKISIINIIQEEDNAHLEFNITTKLGEEILEQIDL